MTISHEQSDAWMPEYIRVILDDGTWLECPGTGEDLDNDSYADLDCYSYGGDAKA